MILSTAYELDRNNAIILSSQFWTAKKNSYELSADNPVKLLGLAHGLLSLRGCGQRCTSRSVAFNRIVISMLLLRSIFFTFLLPGTVTVLIPYWMISSRGADNFTYPGALRYFGLPLIGIGAAGLLWCIWEFFSEGRGTLAPVDPPKHLVVRGLYQYVRNPMYVSVLMILLGEAIFFRSTSILMEAGIFIALAYLFVAFYEEPVLRQQFGESYEKYLQTVGRWIPRWRSKNN